MKRAEKSSFSPPFRLSRPPLSRGNEFRQPESLERKVAQVRRKQNEVFGLRKELLEELFCIPQQKLTVAAVRVIEEQNTQLNVARTEDL